MERDPFLQILELRRAADFREDRESVRIPLNQSLAELNRTAFGDLYLGAVHDRIALALAALFIDHRDRALAIHNDQIAALRLDGLQVDEAHQYRCSSHRGATVPKLAMPYRRCGRYAW